MLKRTIAYEDFNGEKQSDEAYFNLTKTELVRLEIASKNGLAEDLMELTKSEDNKEELLAFFEKLILSSYGKKSEDGKAFVKNDAMRDEFKCSAMYDALLMDLVTDADLASSFIAGILPREMGEAAEKEALRIKTANALNVTETKDSTATELTPGDPPAA